MQSKFISWTPRTKLGHLVKKNHFLSLNDVLKENKIVEPALVDYFEEDLKKEVVAVSRVSHTVTSGKIYQFRVVVLIGNEGKIGCGVGKGIVKAQAIKKAVLEAKKKLITLETLNANGKFTPTKIGKSKKGATTVTVYPLEGSSITASKLGRTYCNICGLKGIKITTGNKKREVKGKASSKLNYFTALHQTISKII